jgi:hypothetical protein
MRVLIGCEESATVRDAFRKMGHDAYSCDILGTRGDSAWHITGDVFKAIRHRGPWDMMIAFPPCTHVCVSGARHWSKKVALQHEALEFMRNLLEANIPKICLENPVGCFSTYWRKPDQIIQPYQFGEDASKKTCLWLKNLPKLTPTKIIQPGPNGRYANQTPSGQNKLGPSPTRAMDRSKTYQGIADAMAYQWGFELWG